MYEIYFAFGLPVRANIRSGVPPSVAARIGEDAERAERNFGHGGPVFGLSEKRWFYKMRLGWLDRPTIGADAEGSRGLRRARRRNADQVWLVTHFSLSLT